MAGSEPSAWAMLLLAAMGLGIYRRRSRKNNSLETVPIFRALSGIGQSLVGMVDENGIVPLAARMTTPRGGSRTAATTYL